MFFYPVSIYAFELKKKKFKTNLCIWSLICDTILSKLVSATTITYLYRANTYIQSDFFVVSNTYIYSSSATICNPHIQQCRQSKPSVNLQGSASFEGKKGTLIRSFCCSSVCLSVCQDPLSQEELRNIELKFKPYSDRLLDDFLIKNTFISQNRCISSLFIGYFCLKYKM